MIVSDFGKDKKERDKTDDRLEEQYRTVNNVIKAT